MESERVDIRPSPIAGTWYPGDAQTLAQSIDAYLAEADDTPLPGQVIGVMVPHAGHRYSGLVAAYAFRKIAGMAPPVVAVLSPLHMPYPGRVLSSGHDAYATPLGIIPLAQDLLAEFEKRLMEKGGIPLTRIRNDAEHSLEIELPFLQRTLAAPFQLIPVMLRDQDRETAEIVGHALADVLQDRHALLVASSDLSHFYSEPIAESLDEAMLQRVEAFDPAAVLDAEQQGVGFACGRGAIAAALWAAKDLGARGVKILYHATSADVTHDTASVVGYASAAIYR